MKGTTCRPHPTIPCTFSHIFLVFSLISSLYGPSDLPCIFPHTSSILSINPSHIVPNPILWLVFPNMFVVPPPLHYSIPVPMPLNEVSLV